MHLTTWLDGKPVRNWDLGQYGDTPQARAALEDLVSYLNSLDTRRTYELSELGERVGEGEGTPACNQHQARVEYLTRWNLGDLQGRWDLATAEGRDMLTEHLNWWEEIRGLGDTVSWELLSPEELESMGNPVTDQV